MRKVFLLASFFSLTPVFLILCALFVSFLSFQKSNPGISLSFFRPTPSVAYAALPSTTTGMSDTFTLEDARVQIVRQFFKKYGSPLEPFAENVVKAADSYGLDFRFIPAIAMQESNLCKKAPEDSFNCWGYGIYGGKIHKFDDYPQAIDTVTKTLAKDYKTKGLHTPEEIMSRYTPSSDGSWAFAVTHFMEQLK